MTRPRLTLVGTGHVFRIGPAVRDAICCWVPDMVFVELDPGRYRALQARRSGVPRPKAGFIQRRLEMFQESVAGMYGAEVGEEMLAAVAGAHDVGAQVRFVDPPAEDTLGRVLGALTWREKGRAVGMGLKSLASGLFRRSGTQDIEDEIARYQSDPDAALEMIRQKFPSIHRIVIDERDEQMAARIRRGLMGRTPRSGGNGPTHGVAVVGDGHVAGILRRLAEDIDVEVYRLHDVRGGGLPQPGNSVYRFGFDLRPVDAGAPVPALNP